MQARVDDGIRAHLPVMRQQNNIRQREGMRDDAVLPRQRGRVKGMKAGERNEGETAMNDKQHKHQEVKYDFAV